jgi:uncharacterized membrane protein
MPGIRIPAAGLAAMLVVATLNFVAQPLWAQDPVPAESGIDFALEIKPLFEASCIRCHGPEEQEGDFRIDEKERVLDYVDAGDGSFSDLYLHLTGADDYELMPPEDEGGPLPADQIAKIKRWIDEGVVWPDSVALVMPPKEVIDQVKEEVRQVQAQKDKQDGNGQLFLEIVGLLHPVLLHFPVALLIGGAFFALFGMRGESPLADAAYYCLWLAAWTSVLACLSGWWFAFDKNYNDWQSFGFNRSIDIHRWGGITVSVLAFLLAFVAAGARRRDPYGSGASWKFGMILLAVLTGFVAHHGGKMTHVGLHDRLFNKATILYENLTGSKPVNPAASGDAQPNGEKPSGDDAEEGNAETSGDDSKDA